MQHTSSKLTAAPDIATNARPLVEQAFEPRPTRALGLHRSGGWTIRLHAVTRPGETLDEAQFKRGLALAAGRLPDPAVAPGRFGVGFAILHQGRGMDYVVLCWWSRENELPMQVVVRQQMPDAPWRFAQAEESICVWDIQIIKQERDAFVGTVLARSGTPDVEGYLRALGN